MMEIRNVEEKTRAGKIIGEALKEALSGVTPRSYREIWSDMLGRVMGLQNPGFMRHWQKAKPEYQDEIGRLTGLPFNEFLGHIARIENSVIKALAEHGKRRMFN